MKQFYSFSKPLILSLLFIALMGGQAFSQSPCGVNYPTFEDFNTQSNATAGFTGYSNIPTTTFNYTYDASSTNGYIEFKPVTAAKLQTVVSPTYAIANNAPIINFGFVLGGSVQVSSISVTILYQDINNNFKISPAVTLSPSYSNGSANICSSIAVPTDINTSRLFQLQIDLLSNGNGTNITFDNFSTNGNNSQIALPVTFVSLTAKKTEAGTELTWNVADEKGVNRYEVEKSTDARSFAKIGEVAATKKASYSFVDTKSASTTSYYRIRNVDLDGNAKYSPIVKVNASGSGNSNGVRVYPIPAVNGLTVQHNEMNTAATITISTVEGKVLKVVKAGAGTTHTAVDLAGIASGTYVLRMTDEKGNIESTKFVKQ